MGSDKLKKAQSVVDRRQRRATKKASTRTVLTAQDYPVLCIDPGKKAGFCYRMSPVSDLQLLTPDMIIAPKTIICERPLTTHQKGVTVRAMRAGYLLGAAAGTFSAKACWIDIAEHRKAFDLPANVDKTVAQNRAKAYHKTVDWSPDEDDCDAQMIAYAVGRGALVEVW
jgi:hypothetical protein